MSEFENETPVDDALVVLDLLCGSDWERMTTREIHRFHPRQKKEPYVRIGRHHEWGDSRFLDFRVTERVADELVGSGLVQGKPQWGYTDMDTLRASDHGKGFLRQERGRLELDEKLRSDRWLSGRL